MKSFEQFLENNSEENVELNHERGKLFIQIIKTLEYGLKNESELNNAVQKAIKLAETGYQLNSSHFSGWAKLTGKYGGPLRDL